MLSSNALPRHRSLVQAANAASQLAAITMMLILSPQSSVMASDAEERLALEGERRAAVLAEARHDEEETRKRAIEQGKQDARQAKEEEQRQAIKEAEERRKVQEARAPEYNAFNVAYNDFLNGKYDSAAVAFKRFVKEYPATTLTANAHYWLGESYYQQNDYVRAMQAFEYVSNEYPANEKVPASLFKLGLAARETGDLPKFKKNLERVIDDFPSSLEAKLAKKALAYLR
jgi:tol-pal system protein YbgF